jgi:Fe-S oxidoreductase
MPFECSLCRLCEAICPAGVQPARMILEMRRHASAQRCRSSSKHKAILNYEQRGTSSRYSYYALPESCDTVFFPGCALPGARPQTTLRLFEHLQGQILNLGIVLDCCTKPSHDLGRMIHFEKMFGEMKDYLTAHGVRRVLLACPSCYRTFSDYGDPLQVATVYETMAANRLPLTGTTRGVVVVHDPCAIREETHIHEVVRKLSAAKGLTVEQMFHEGEKTICCGEGGAARLVAPQLARNWATLRNKEADRRRIITYCAGCVYSLGSMTPTSHLLDLLFAPEETMLGKIGIAKSPLTYINRILLKSSLKRKMTAEITREGRVRSKM